MSKKQWSHITKKHPQVADYLEDIMDALKNPSRMTDYSLDENVRYFYKEFKERDASERYLLVSVKYLNGEGFVITSFFTNKIAGLKWNIT